MVRTVEAIYDSFYTASQAVQELHNTGFPYDWMNILTRPERGDGAGPETEVKPEAISPEVRVNSLATGAQIGAGVGAAVGLTGALLAAIGELQLPGLAPGPLPALISAGGCLLAGLVAGGLLGNLAGMGIPEQEIRQYAKSIHQGDVMLIVVADWNTVDPVIEILNRHYPLEIKEKAPAGRNTPQPGPFDTSSRASAGMRDPQDRP